MKVQKIWRAIKSQWSFFDFQGPGTLEPILAHNHFTAQSPGRVYGGVPGLGQAVLRRPKDTLRLPKVGLHFVVVLSS